MKITKLAIVCLPVILWAGCGGGGMGGSSSLTLSLANSSAQVFQGQGSVTVNATLARTGTTGNVTLAVTGLPQGATDTIQSPGSGNSGSIIFSAGTGAAAGTYSLTITASDGTNSAQTELSLTIGAVAVISSTPSGQFSVAMSTSFQPAEWDNQFFTLNPSATTTLGNLNPHHIRLQGISQGVPQGSEGTSDTTWNFTILDDITQPVLSVGDHSPEFQIAKAPAFMYVNDDSSQSFSSTTDFSAFATYAQNLVKYYNKGGFTVGNTLYGSPGYVSNGYTIIYWAIYNEPSINNSVTATEYTTMYNTLVPAMQTIDSSLKFVAMELCCSSEDWLQTFAPNVTAQVDVVASHYYASCNQKDTDEMLMDAVPGFVSSVQLIRTNLSNTPLASVPIWVTENNVNADYANANGDSTCNPGQAFVTDVRGSSPFLAAWRPYVFSQLGKAGVQALYHWDFGADKQYGEVDYDTGAYQLSYWVDYWLGQIFPPAAGSQLLTYTATDDAELETLPVVNNDKSVVIMVSNHAVNDPATDNNGPGAPRTVLVDVSALGTFSSGSLMIIDENTNVTSGPTATSATPASQMTITLDGYDVAFLTLKP